MAKGKKGGKKVADDDWENDIPTVADLNAAADTGSPVPPNDASASKAPIEASADDFADEFSGGGGLLGAIKKNAAKKKKGKGKGNNNQQDDDDFAAKLAAMTTGGDDADALGEPAAATEDDFEFPDKKGKGKAKNSGGAAGAAGGTASPAPEAEGEDDEEEEKDASGKVMTKKEKEKAKKEKEKLKKKAQAQKKKAAGGGAAPAASAPAATVPAEASSSTPAAAAAAAEPAKAGPKKKLPPALAALQRQQEALRRAEEEARELREIEEREAAKEEKRFAEEEAKKAEQRAKKKEAEKAKKEQLKKEGKLLTKAQKEAKAKTDLRLAQMAEQGIVVAGLADPTAAKKKPVYDKKKKKPTGKSKEELVAEEAEKKKAEADKLAKEEAENAAAAEQAAREEEERKKAEEKPVEEDNVIESWEDAIDEDGNVKESWDHETDEDEDAPGEASSKPEAKSLSANGATNGKGKALTKKFDDEDGESDESSSEEEEQTVAQQQIQKRKDEAADRRKKQHEEALAARSKDNLRSPICCILGHVDTGKTKLLDKIRQTNVQEGEAGGITQQIGATYFPVEAIRQKTEVVNKDGSFEFKVPGLLVIDTPGHESFTNLRSRGSSLCNIAILVVDIMHGLEPQTLESIRLLKDRKTPFIVALNKIDRLYSWKAVPNNGFQDSLTKQNKSVQAEFKDRLERTKLAFAEQGLNSELFYDNKTPARTVSLVPTSAHTGEGIPDMLKLLITLTQTRMTDKLMYLSELECTVLEVKVIEGLGTTIDVVLSNGILREGDRIVLCGLNGPISTNIRALLTPQPLKELRIKGSYVHHKEVKAALGIKIAANDMEDAIAGSRLMVVGPDDDEEDIEEEVMGDLEGLLHKVTKGDKGVSVQASTLGSLEALLEFLKVSKIPVMSISIGPVYKRDVMRAGAMLEKHKEFAVMLCFDVKIDKEAQAYADDVGVTLFTADIIYHLFDAFTAYQKELLEQKKRETADLAVFPCVLQIAAVFHQRDPIVVGVDVIEGTLRLGTPIAVMKPGTPDPVLLGRVTSIELNHKQIPTAKKGSPSVAVKIEAGNQPTYSRHWDDKDTLYSHVSRKSIDVLKTHFRDEVAKEDWQLMVQLKKVFKID